MATEDGLAELKAMIAAQEERIARLQAEVEQQREEKQGLIDRLTAVEHGGEGRLSRAGLFKIAAAGAAGLLGVGALENNGTGVALADSPPTTFTSTTVQQAVKAQNTAADGSGGDGTFSSTQDSAHNGLYGYNFGSGTGVRGTSAAGGPGVYGNAVAGKPGVYGFNNDVSTPGPGVQGKSYGSDSWGVAATAPGVAGISLRDENSQSLPGKGVGVYGQSGDQGIGVFGASVDDNGSVGLGTGTGIFGRSGSGNGVIGEALTGTGVYGSSSENGTGVYGSAIGGGTGVAGYSNQFGVSGTTTGTGTYATLPLCGVLGVSTKTAVGVMGITNEQSSGNPAGQAPIPPPEIPSTASNTGANVGVRGVSYNSTTGVAGVSFADTSENTLGSGIGVQGWSGSGFGMLGKSTSSTGVLGQSQNWYGVQGNSVYGDGVYGVSTHLYGAEVNGGKAPLRLVPSGSAGAPSASGHKAGELYVDSNGILYYFNGTAWKTLTT